MVRSDIINKAREKIIQGAEDKFWTHENWNDYFHEACEIVFTEIVESNLSYYRATATITKDDITGLFPLPKDRFGNNIVYKIERVVYEGEELYFVNKKERIEYYVEGFSLFNDNIRLENLDVPSGKTIFIEFIKLPKEMGEWDGTCDIDSDDTFVPDPPLDGDSGGRLLARIINVLALTKDGEGSVEQTNIIESIIEKFINKINDRQDTEELLINMN